MDYQKRYLLQMMHLDSLGKLRRLKFSNSTYKGVHPSEALMQFPPLSHFPQVPKRFSDSEENFPDLTFSQKISNFHPPKILTISCLLIDHKFRISPLFPLFQFVSPISGNFSFPHFCKMFPPDFVKLTCFYIP